MMRELKGREKSACFCTLPNYLVSPAFFQLFNFSRAEVRLSPCHVQDHALEMDGFDTSMLRGIARAIPCVAFQTRIKQMKKSSRCCSA